MVSPLGQQTIKRVAEKLEAGEAAGLTEIVELIQRLSGAAYDTSIQELATLIGKDLVVTAKVIAAANTLGYNPAGVAVTTITGAIQVIGFNKIRQLAVSLLLVESADRTLQPSEKREIAALALCSGLMAEAIMSRRATCSPEHAFICASLRSYGRLLMTTFMIDDYRRARIMAASGATEDDAFRTVLGLTPLELGYHLLASAHLPDPILRSLRALPPEAVKNATQQPDIELLALSDLAVRMCELAFRPDLTARGFAAESNALAAQTSKTLGLDADSMLAALRATADQLHEFSNAFGLRALSDQFAPRLRARVDGEDLPLPAPEPARRKPAADAVSGPAERGRSAEPGAPATSAAAATPAPEAQSLPIPTANLAPHAGASALAATPNSASRSPLVAPSAGAEAEFQSAFQSGIEQIAGLLEEEPVDMQKVYSVVLKTALNGFGTNEGVVFVRDPVSRRFVAAQGNGATFQAIARKPLGREEDRDVFGLCLQRMEDVLIYDASDPKIGPHLPAWIKASRLGAFVLLPMHDSKRPFAVLMAGWPGKRTAGFTVAQIRHVRSMLKLAGTARRLADARS